VPTAGIARTINQGGPHAACFDSFQVQDFAKWKAAYDGHLSTRKTAGLTERYVLRNADNPNEVFVLFEASDLDKARAFASSADLRQKMQEAGVADKPDIYFLT
jgi:hypothetical protein